MLTVIDESTVRIQGAGGGRSYRPVSPTAIRGVKAAQSSVAPTRIDSEATIRGTALNQLNTARLRHPVEPLALPPRRQT